TPNPLPDPNSRAAHLSVHDHHPPPTRAYDDTTNTETTGVSNARTPDTRPHGAPATTPPNTTNPRKQDTHSAAYTPTWPHIPQTRRISTLPTRSNYPTKSRTRWYWAVDVLQAAGAQVHLAHPLGVKAFEYRRVKNDERDAADIADLLRMGRLPEA